MSDRITWYQVDRSDVTDTLREKHHPRGGVVVGTSVSPYDVPERVVAEYNEASNQLSFYFDYCVSTEKTKHSELASWMSVDEGTKSGRIYKISVRVPRAGVQSTEYLANLKAKLAEALAEIKRRAAATSAPARESLRAEVSANVITKVQDRALLDLDLVGI